MGIEGLAPAIERPTRLAIEGRLARNPMLHLTPGGAPHLTLVIRQAGKSLPIVATYRGQVAEIASLEAWAIAHRVGAHVFVMGTGLDVENAEEGGTPAHLDDDHWLRLGECQAYGTVSLAAGEAALV